MDTARLHVIALLAPEIESQRIFGFGGQFNFGDIISTVKELRPDLELPTPPKDEGRDLTDVVPRAKALKLLQEYFGQKDWTSLRSSIEAGIRGL